MKAYVINLEKSIERRTYMDNIMKDIPEIEIVYISAVDGRVLSKAQKKSLFNIEKFERKNLKHVRDGEIGCTLSHQQCYKIIINSKEECAFIFEDDIVLNENISPLIKDIEEWLTSEEPRVLLLSGWFWYYNKKSSLGNKKIRKVINGFLTHSYALNKAAAKLMSDERPWYLADSWRIFIKRGVKIYGFTPHLCDQDWSGVFQSEIISENERYHGFNLKSWFSLNYHAFIKRVCIIFNHFEAPKHLKKRIITMMDN